jgi:RNA polymerase sigma-70 factor (ECF subfamily)
MDGFAGAWSLSTWLTRIVVNQALERKRTAQRRERLLRERSVTDIADHRERLMAASEATRSPEAEGQIAKPLERAVANLPETFRPVFVLREIEGLSVEETADILRFRRRP